MKRIGISTILFRSKFFRYFAITACLSILTAISAGIGISYYSVSAQSEESVKGRSRISRETAIRLSEETVIATITVSGTVYAVGLKDGAPFHSDVLTGASRSFGLFNGHLAYSKPTSDFSAEELMIINLRTEKSIRPFPDQCVTAADWNPITGKLAAIVGDDAKRDVVIYDQITNTAEYLERRNVRPDFLRWSEKGEAIKFLEGYEGHTEGLIKLVSIGVPSGYESVSEISISMVDLLSAFSDSELGLTKTVTDNEIEAGKKEYGRFNQNEEGQTILSIKRNGYYSDTYSNHIPLRRIPGGMILRKPENQNSEWAVWNFDSWQLVPLVINQETEITQNLQAAEQGLVGAWYLSFPLDNRTPYSARINSVYDHSRSANYYSNDEVIAYTGERGQRIYGADYTTTISGRALYGFKNSQKSSFRVNGSYFGGGDSSYLYYDGHPGIDYRTKDSDQDPTYGIVTVRASAEGIVDCTGSCTEGAGVVSIDHGNGFRTIYMHLSAIYVSKNQSVNRGDTIGKSGETGAPGSPHLHFEVRRKVGNTWIAVDPYGWEGGCKDPYTPAPNLNLWTKSGTTWDFATDKNAQGWEPVNTSCFSIHNGAFWIDPAGSDPYIRSLPLVNVSASSFNTVEINMISAAPDTRGAVYFTTDISPNWEESKKVTFDVSNNSVWKVYNVRMDGNSNWRGRITGIRIDPAEGGLAGTSADTVAFDRISLKYSTAVSVPSKATMVNPAPGSTFSSSTVTFNWNSGSGVTEYFLYLGNSIGKNDIYGQSQSLRQSVTVSGIPTDGRTVYVRLYSKLNGGWDYNDYTYKAFNGGSVLAQMISPASGSTFTSSTVTFSWSSGIGISQYWLYLGTSPGANNLYNRSQGLNRSVTVYNLPVNGQPIYTTLWSYTPTGWKYQTYTYRAR